MKNINEKDRKQWAEKYGKVVDFTVGDKTIVLRPPNMVDLKRGFSIMREEGEIEYAEDMMKNLYLGGDRAIIEDDNYFIPGRTKIMKLLEYPDPEIESLENGSYKVTVGTEVCEIRKPNRNDLKQSDRKNKSNKPFVDKEHLFDLIVDKETMTDGFKDKNKAEIRMPLYKAIEELQNDKIASLKKH